MVDRHFESLCQQGLARALLLASLATVLHWKECADLPWPPLSGPGFLHADPAQQLQQDSHALFALAGLALLAN